MIAEAFCEAMNVIAQRTTAPLPPGITAVETNNWRLAVNNGRENASWDDGGCGAEIGPYGVAAVHKDILAMAMLDAAGGTIGGGMTEDQFIDEMKAAQAEIAA
jgi:hypothetical protein